MSILPMWQALPSDSFLEWAFLRWVLTPACDPSICAIIEPQHLVHAAEHSYRIDYAFIGQNQRIAVELDGYAFHSARGTFSTDRMRQNDLQTAGWMILRFTYDAIRSDTARCIAQFQTALRRDSLLSTYCVPTPVVELPEMEPESMWGLSPSPATFDPRPSASHSTQLTYFESVRGRLRLSPLRNCQLEAFIALGRYYDGGSNNAACVMAVGAGKTALGVVSTLAFTGRRALIITPGSVIRGTFDRAFDATAVSNALYGLPGGPLLPGLRAPHVLTLDRAERSIQGISRQELLSADVIITNFHSLGTGENSGDLLAKLRPEDIDFIVVDEAHIAAADSYQRAFAHFVSARTLLVSACFQRLDGKHIEADVVYRYRLIDSIAEGNAKRLCVRRFAPETEETVYEIIWSSGRREEIRGREALLAVIEDERRLPLITAKSEAPLRELLRTTRAALDAQAEQLAPVKPRVLFSALGERHAEQVARLAEECGIPCAHLHYAMPETRIRTVRERFEQDAGDLQGIVQLKMLGQGYDFPPICVVVPLRPYGSFGEFYQFIGRGIRTIRHSALTTDKISTIQVLDIIYHAEMGLDDHIEAIYRENVMDPTTQDTEGEAAIFLDRDATVSSSDASSIYFKDVHARSSLDAVVLFQSGQMEERIIHDQGRVEQRRVERELASFAQRYAEYASRTSKPVSFEQYVKVMRQFGE